MLTPEATAPQYQGRGKAPQIRRRYITIADVEKYGGARGCKTCTMMFMGERGARPPHTDACRARFEELWANDQDPEAEAKAEADMLRRGQ